MSKSNGNRIITRSLAVELTPDEKSQVNGGGPFYEQGVTEVTVSTSSGPAGDQEKQLDQ
jgi:hypothetical protein